jgi:hypothetical protein
MEESGLWFGRQPVSSCLDFNELGLEHFSDSAWRKPWANGLFRVDADTHPPLTYPGNHRAHGAPGPKDFMAEGYCVKCKAKKEIANGVEEVMKNGRKAIKGKCPTCGTVMFKILGGKAAPAASNPTNPPAAA